MQARNHQICRNAKNNNHKYSNKWNSDKSVTSIYHLMAQGKELTSSYCLDLSVTTTPTLPWSLLKHRQVGKSIHRNDWSFWWTILMKTKRGYTLANDNVQSFNPMSQCNLKSVEEWNVEKRVGLFLQTIIAKVSP